VVCSLEWKDALCGKYVTAALRPRKPSEQKRSDRKLCVQRWAESSVLVSNQSAGGVSARHWRTARPARRSARSRETMVLAFSRHTLHLPDECLKALQGRFHICRGLMCIAVCNGATYLGCRIRRATSQCGTSSKDIPLAVSISTSQSFVPK